MTKKTFTLLLLLCSLWAAAQEGTLIKGVVAHGEYLLEGTHIQNVTNKESSISNSDGEFTLLMSVGDTLVFSHVSMQDLIKFVGEEEMAQGTLSITMIEKSNELDEVLLQEERDYALELGIISERKEKLSVNERRLQTAGDFKPVQLLGLLGGSLPVDPILNAVNGRTKKLKRNVRVEQKHEKITYLKQQYLDYMIKMFDTPQNEIEPFLDYLVEQESLEAVMSAKNDEQLKFFLIDEWYKFQDR